MSDEKKDKKEKVVKFHPKKHKHQVGLKKGKTIKFADGTIVIDKNQ